MTQVNLKKVLQHTLPIDEYITRLSRPFKEKFIDRKQTYHLHDDVALKLQHHAKDIVIVVFSAEWCNDCAANLPVLALVAEKTGVPVRVFGGLEKDPLHPQKRWRIPPSPPEVHAYHVQKIPHMIIFNKHGTSLGTIIENPKNENTLEEEILSIIHRN